MSVEDKRNISIKNNSLIYSMHRSVNFGGDIPYSLFVNCHVKYSVFSTFFRQILNITQILATIFNIPLLFPKVLIARPNQPKSTLKREKLNRKTKLSKT